MLFFSSSHCQSQAHCATCRKLNAGRVWRELILRASEDIEQVDFPCPLDKPWLAAAEEKPKELNAGEERYYLPEMTVVMAELRACTPEELQNMGLGVDERGFFPLLKEDVPVAARQRPSTPTLGKVVNMVKAMKDVMFAQVADRASLPEIQRRLITCATCRETDSAGNRLYRVADDKLSCGIPMDPRASEAKLLRDPVIDGCGCWLADKCSVRAQACPRNKWGPETASANTGVPASKGRCCGSA